MTVLKPFGLFCAAVCFAGAAQAATYTIDFEEFSDGDIVSRVDFGAGDFANGADVTASGNSSSSPDEARAYNTTNLDGLDPDLDAPFTGPVPNPGNVLVVQGPLSTGTPNDDGQGGDISFTFDRMVTFLGFDAFDDVDNLTVTGFLDDAFVASTSISIGSDNESGQVAGLSWDVDLLIFDFGHASGAIDNLVVDVAPIPLPAGAPLLLAGLGAFAWLKRKKS